MIEISKQLVVYLVSAHLAADSLFQFNLERLKGRNVLVSLKGAAVAATLSYLLCGAWVRWEIPSIIFVTHAAIDMARTWSANGGIRTFLAGQAAHNLVVLAVAAKSILRFGEIKQHENRMEAEYIIIGTLMSFGYGILLACATKFFLETI